MSAVKTKPKVKTEEEDEEGAPFRVRKVREEEPESVQVQEAPEASDEETEEVAPEPRSRKAPPKAEERKAGWVEFTCYEEIDPAPIIGRFNFVMELGISKLENKGVYIIPRDAADHLVDKKKGIISKM